MEPDETVTVPETHAILSPSSAHRWCRCPVSALRSRNYENTTSEYAEEGRIAHALAEAMLTGKAPPDEIPDDMYDYVKAYVEQVEAMSHGASAKFVETKFDLSVVLGGPDLDGSPIKGTADFVAIVGNELQVHDLKYGKGVAVEAQDNEQLILYALGALELAERVSDEITDVRVVIHQPRLNNVSEAVYPICELREKGNQIKAIVEIIRTMDGDESARPSEKACRFCPCKADCADAQALVQDVVGVDEFDDIDGIAIHIKETENDVLAHGLEMLPFVEMWVKAIKEESLKRMLNGEQITGYKLVAGRPGNRIWIDPDQAESAMKKGKMKVDEMYKKELISPTVAEKTIAKSNPKLWALLQEVITRRDPAPTVVPDSDKRPAMHVKAAADEFDSFD